VPPRTWVILGDKGGDNGQVETILKALDWPVAHKYVHMKPQWVLGKPRYRPSLQHLDSARSDTLVPPWPDLIITVGRRPSMAALWVREQSGGHSRIVLVGKPSGHMADFALIIASGENQMPPLPNVLCTALPFMRLDPARVTAEAARWEARLAPLPRPLIAILVGGETNPFVMDRGVARRLVDTARWVRDSLGGTPYLTTSRRTTPEVVELLQQELPEGAELFTWSAEAADNPYRALLGSADGFIVTGDSISMMVEVAQMRKPLAIFPLPAGRFGRLDLWRRSLAHWLCNPRQRTRGDRWRQALARAIHRVDVFKLLSATRDFRAFHRLLVERGLAVWAGQPFQQPRAELPDDVGIAVARIRALFDIPAGAEGGEKALIADPARSS